jgi:site-specific recombinase XerC
MAATRKKIMARKANNRKGWTVTREKHAGAKRVAWLATVYKGGKRERKRWTTKEEATAWASARSAEMEKDGLAAGGLSDEERRAALSARQSLAEGESLADAARELAECRNALGDGTARGAVLDAAKAFAAARKVLAGRASIEEAVEFWARHHPGGEDKTLGDLADGYLSRLRRAGLSPAHVRAVDSKLSRLVGDPVRGRGDGRRRDETRGLFAGFGRERKVADVSRQDLLGLLERLEGRGYSRGTLRSWRVLLKSLFRFAATEYGIETAPAENLGKVKVEGGVPEFLGVEETEKILRAAERVAPECVCGMAILFFAGVRPLELTGQYALQREVTGADGTVEKVPGGMRGGLLWRDVDAKGGFIRLTAAVAKTTQARLVPMSDNLRAWLLRWGGERKGRVVKNPVAWKRARKKTETAAGVSMGHDFPRHSFATFHIALHGDRNLLETAMGHTVGSKVLETAYRGLATREDAERYWAIMPSEEEGERVGGNMTPQEREEGGGRDAGGRRKPVKAGSVAGRHKGRGRGAERP